MVQKYGKKAREIPLIFIIMKGVVDLLRPPPPRMLCQRYRNCFAQNNNNCIIFRFCSSNEDLFVFQTQNAGKCFLEKAFFHNMQQTSLGCIFFG
jgi:hypothetical protein